MTLRGYHPLYACIGMTIIIMAVACGQPQKKSMRGDENVSLSDFVAFFPEMPLPYSATDTTLDLPENDSNIIDRKVMIQMLGDSLAKPLLSTSRQKVYAIGRFGAEDEETYLLLESRGTEKGIFLAVLDEKMAPRAVLPLIGSKGKMAETDDVTIDKKKTITLVDRYRAPGGEINTYTSVYAFSNAVGFMEVMHDGIKNGEELVIINPLDTFASKRLHSGDYGKPGEYFLSIRDHESEKKMYFFLYMNKAEGCTGELKGEAVWITRDSASFVSGTENCSMSFRFKGRTATIKEQVGCGDRRPVSCSFNGSVQKK